MEQLDFFSIPSPCIGVCQSNSRGYCKGCFRSREERFHWQHLSNEQKRNVIRLCRQRYLRVMRAKRQQATVGVYDESREPIQPDLFGGLE
ncbi:DUF1289 domain-containing protein [Photobacterium aquae]|uniref:DUF1289 domain-containing protein n=1 Tax=Photobacterium aquae TaxID=1195763 RepID=UPI000A02732C|nr:DUF1289 domain-containing protein [Photobacterium aquae]